QRAEGHGLAPSLPDIALSHSPCGDSNVACDGGGTPRARRYSQSSKRSSAERRVLKAPDWLLPYLTLLCLIPLAAIAMLPVMAAALLVRAGIRNLRSGGVVDASLATYLLFGFAMWVSELQRPDIFHLVWG